MTELTDLIGIYGSIDREAQARYEELAPDLGRYFSLYREPEPAVGLQGDRDGWFSAFEGWLERRRVDVNEPSEPVQFPSYREALEHMADRTPRPRAMARRLLAVAALMQTFEALRPDGAESGLVVGALTAGGTLAPSRRAAEQLHQLLWERFDGMGSWTPFLEAALDQELVPVVLRVQTTAPPCVGKVITKENPLDPTDDLPVAKLTTSFPVAVPFDRALVYLNPANWPKVSDFWCHMDLTKVLSPTERIYWEQVGLDCDDPTLCVSTDLKFTFTRQPQSASAIYNLPAPPKATDDILVDQGVLLLSRDGDGVYLETSKCVAFSGSMNGAYLAMFMCATGYGAAVEEAIFNGAAQAGRRGIEPFPLAEGEGPYWDQPEGQRPPSTGRRRFTPGGGSPFSRYGGRRAPTGGGQAPPASAAPADPLGKVVEELAEAAQTCFTQQASAYQAAMGKAAGGDYGIDDYVATMADLWTRGLKDLPLLSKLGRTALGSIPTYYRVPPSDDPER